MHHHVIESMVKALKPALKSQSKAQRILEKFWTDKIAILWDTEDVFRAANECEVALTRKEAIQVLEEMHQAHNHQYGIRWSDFTAYIEKNVLGRKLTKQELKRFVEQDILTIQK